MQTYFHLDPWELSCSKEVLADLSLQAPDSEWLRLCDPWGLCCSYSILLWSLKAARRQEVKGYDLCCPSVLFTKTGNDEMRPLGHSMWTPPLKWSACYFISIQTQELLKELKSTFHDLTLKRRFNDLSSEMTPCLISLAEFYASCNVLWTHFSDKQFLRVG